MAKGVMRFAFVLSLLSLAAAPARSQVGFPGSTWGSLTRDFSGLEGNGTQGRVTQGVSWIKLPHKFDIRTMAAYHWRIRRHNRPFYNAQGPGLGVALASPNLDLGVDFNWQNFPELRRTEEDFEFYLSWYKKIDLAQFNDGQLFGIPVKGLPLSSWGRLSYDLNDIEGHGAQGWIGQGVDWFAFGPGITFRTLGRFHWRFRSENRPFYNAQGPAVGAEFDFKGLQFGAEHYWRNFPELGRSTQDFQVYLQWYYSWDFKRQS